MLNTSEALILFEHTGSRESLTHWAFVVTQCVSRKTNLQTIKKAPILLVFSSFLRCTHFQSWLTVSGTNPGCLIHKTLPCTSTTQFASYLPLRTDFWSTFILSWLFLYGFQHPQWRHFQRRQGCNRGKPFLFQLMNFNNTLGHLCIISESGTTQGLTQSSYPEPFSSRMPCLTWQAFWLHDPGRHVLHLQGGSVLL